MYNDTSTISSYAYPGDYVPLLSEDQIDFELCRVSENGALVPPVNVVELADTFRVEIAIPGMRREDFLIHIDGNVLDVRVLHKEASPWEAPNFKLREFNYKCFEKRINLPFNADAEFLSAEYKAGVLRVIMPKADYPVRCPYMRVVVY